MTSTVCCLLCIGVNINVTGYSGPDGSSGPLLFQVVVERSATTCLGGLNLDVLSLEAPIESFSSCDFIHKCFLPISLDYPRAEMFRRALDNRTILGVFRN